MDLKHRRYCSIVACIHNKGFHDSNIHLFKEPANKQLAAKWRNAIWGDEKHRGRWRICQFHFAEDDLKYTDRLILKADAVPFLSWPSGSNSRHIESDEVEYIEVLSDFESIDNEPTPEVQIKLESPETNTKSISCIQHEAEIRELKAEVKRIRKWAKSQSLSPPSPPATPPRNERTKQSIDPNYEYCMEEEEDEQQQQQQQQQKNVDENKSGGDKTTTKRMTSPVKMFECGKCGKKFELPRHLRKHMDLVHDDTVAPLRTPMKKIYFECYLCNERYIKLAFLRSHMTYKHTLSIKKRCGICDKHFFEATKHSCAGLKLDCEYCSVQFDSLHRLKVHLDDHHVQKMFYCCIFCNRSFEMRSFMELHKSTHKPGEFACTECSEKFDYKLELWQHGMISHQQRRTHSCGECGESFPLAHLLNKHKLVHGIRPFKCAKCPFAATTVQTLRKHMGCHRSNATYPTLFCCHICDEKLDSKKAYQHHIERHTRTEEDRIHPTREIKLEKIDTQ